jgi:ribosome-associated translation inhibitor RaiA
MDVAVTARGEVADAEKDRARETVAALDECVSDPVLGAHVTLRLERNPRLERPARAEAELNVNGHMLRGRVASETMSKAIDTLGSHLERQLQDFVNRRARLKRRSSEPRSGEWHHGQVAPPRASFDTKPVTERSIVRRKTFALAAGDPLQAVRDLLDLDYDFYLFHDAERETEAVVYQRNDGTIGLIYPDASYPPLADEGPVRQTSPLSEPITVEGAIEQMNALGHRFMFFNNADSGRGNVIYLRYDGDYGLIEPGDGTERAPTG